MKKLFLFITALLLSVCVFAQNDNGTLKGDVNGDGSVSVTDVTMTISHILGQTPEGFDAVVADANGDGSITITDVTMIINIILKGEIPQETVYYWYAGQTQPSSISGTPTVDDTNFINNKWHTLSASQISQTVTGGTAGNKWYIAVPTFKRFIPRATDLITPDNSTIKLSTGITVNGVAYDVWESTSTGAKRNVYMKADAQTYYWYAGQTKPESIDGVPDVDDINFTNNKWHTLGSTGSTSTTINKTVTGGTSGNVWYISAPDGFIATASDLSTPDNSLTKLSNITVNGQSYVVYQSNSTPAKCSVYMAKNANASTYYWYVGQTDPSTMSSISPIVTSYENGGGWYELGTTLPTSIDQLIKGGENGHIWYVAVPVDANLVPGSSADPDTSVTTGSTKTFGTVTYQIYIYEGVTGTRGSFELNQ